MTATYPTLLDMAKRNARDRAVPLIEETSKWIPEISGINYDGSRIPGVGLVKTIDGINYETFVRTTLPTVGFRDVNEGVEASTSKGENRLVGTFVLNPRWEADVALVDRSEDGPEVVIADEAMAQMEASMQLLGIQFFKGRTGHAKGHPGLLQSIISDYVVDATGSGNSTGSVWAVKFGVKDVCWVWGKRGQLKIPDVTIETVQRSGKSMRAYVQDMMAFPGVQVGSTRSIGRIKNIQDADGKRLTDDHVFALFAKMKVRPDVLFMCKTALEQLRQSRTATNATGQPAPRPTEVDGVPIAPTESLAMDETAS